VDSHNEHRSRFNAVVAFLNKYRMRTTAAAAFLVVFILFLLTPSYHFVPRGIVWPLQQNITTIAAPRPSVAKEIKFDSNPNAYDDNTALARVIVNLHDESDCAVEFQKKHSTLDIFNPQYQSSFTPECKQHINTVKAEMIAKAKLLASRLQVVNSKNGSQHQSAVKLVYRFGNIGLMGQAKPYVTFDPGQMLDFRMWRVQFYAVSANA
jgi:hypothetical protein